MVCTKKISIAANLFCLSPRHRDLLIESFRLPPFSPANYLPFRQKRGGDGRQDHGQLRL